MFARVSHFQILPGKMDEVVRIYQDSVVPAARQQKGFKGGYVLADRDTGKGISIALWETEADMKADEGSGFYQQRAAKFKDLVGATAREQYEVIVQA